MEEALGGVGDEHSVKGEGAFVGNFVEHAACFSCEIGLCVEGDEL